MEAGVNFLSTLMSNFSMSNFGTCDVCKGSGSLLTAKYGLGFYTCPCCGGSGTTVLCSPPYIKAKDNARK